MSNPAVITLSNASSRDGVFKRFVIEDNIGESIHIHVDNMRLDFTITEFLEFSEMIRSSLKELDFLKGYSINDFDERFLQACSSILPSLEKIEIEEIELSKLKCIVHSTYKGGLQLEKLAAISNISAYKYLQGNKKDFQDYDQFNYIGVNNENRLLKTLESIKNNNYPFKNKHLILFSNQNIVRDGQHRAAILAHLYGLDCKIKIMRFHFKGNKHLIYVNLGNLKIACIWLIRKIYNKLKRYIQR